SRERRLVDGDISSSLCDAGLTRDVAVVSAAALRETRALPAVVLFREADVVGRVGREQWSTRRQKEGDENRGSRSLGSHASHDARLGCMENANRSRRNWRRVLCCGL